METKTNKLHFFLFLFLFMALFIFAYRNLLSVGMMAFGDLASFPNQMSKIYFESFFSSWQPRGLGNNDQQLPGLFFLALLASILRDNALLVQKIFYFSLLPLAGIAMYIFLRRFLNSYFAKFLASFIYTINPVTIGQFSGGGPGILCSYAVLPLLLLFLFNILEREEGRLHNLLLFTLFFALASSFNIQFPLMIVPLIAVPLFINILAKKNLKYGLKTVLLFVVSYVICFLLMSPGVLPFLKGSADVILPVEILLADVKSTYSLLNIPNLLRLSGNVGAFDWWLGYGDSPAWNIFGFILPALAFLPLLFKFGKQRSRYVIIFSVLASSIILFCWLTHHRLTLGLFREFPFLFVFRNPVKLMIFLPLAYSPLIGITIDRLQEWASTHRANSKILVGYIVVISSIAIYCWPFFTGDLGQSKFRGDSFIVPSVYHEVGEWIEKHRKKEGFFRTLLLPYDHETELSGDLIDRYSFTRPAGVAAVNLPNNDYIKFTLDSLCNEQTNNIGTLLAPASVKYTIVNLASSQKGAPTLNGFFPSGDPENFIKILNKQKDLRLVDQQENFLVYENKEFLPHITAYDRALFIPVTNSTSRLSLMMRLFRTPGFEIGRQLLVFGGQLSSKQRSWFLNNRDVPISQGSAAGTRNSTTGERARSYSYKAVKISQTSYKVSVKSERPLFIVLGETYHPSWNAYVNDEKLEHFPAFYYANGFYLDKTGRNNVKITFDEQRTGNLTIMIWAVAWICLILLLLLSFARRKLAVKKQSF
ncbi:MAG: hypothetical protein QMD08_03780 [Actinomycetota bacterium]|nr:hypothetical protein [Actinomycetota bacterium]